MCDQKRPKALISAKAKKSPIKDVSNYCMTTKFGEANIWRLDENLQLAEF